MKRTLVGIRLDDSLMARIKAVAIATKSNKRIVIEQCVEAHLADLEKEVAVRRRAVRKLRPDEKRVLLEIEREVARSAR